MSRHEMLKFWPLTPEKSWPFVVDDVMMGDDSGDVMNQPPSFKLMRGDEETIISITIVLVSAENESDQNDLADGSFFTDISS
jgi:hypothetical protein